MPIEKSQITTIICDYSTDYAEEKIFLNQISKFVERVKFPCSRETLEGHITASAWIINKEKDSVLLIHHNKLNRWFQPGGHIENIDTSVLHACEREAIEETGIKELNLLSSQIFDIDIHMIPERNGIPEHLHYDIRYAFVASSFEMSLDLTEVNGGKWVKLKECLDDKERYGSIERMVKKTLCEKTISNFNNI